MAKVQKNSEEEAARAKRDLVRLDQQSEKMLGAGYLSKTNQDDDDDRIEIWGRRIGRGLGICFAIFLLAHLLTKYVF